MTDAYALVKVLSRNHGVTQVPGRGEHGARAGRRHALFDKLQRVTTRFLDVTLEYVGEIPEDPYLRRAIREQRPVVSAFPSMSGLACIQEIGTEGR